MQRQQQLVGAEHALVGQSSTPWVANALVAAGGCLWSWDAGTDRLELGPGAGELLGTCPATLEDLSALVHPDDRASRQLALSSALAHGGRWVSSFRIVSGPEVRWIEERGSALVDASGSVHGAFALALDVSDRHHGHEVRETVECVPGSDGHDHAGAHAIGRAAHAALRVVGDSEAFLESIFSTMTDGLALYGRDGRLMRVNPAAREMLGYEDAGQPSAGQHDMLADLGVLDVDGRPVPRDGLPVVAALRGETLRGVPLAFQRADGGKLWATVGAAPIQAPDGSVVGAVVSLGDVSRLRDLQEQREDLSRMIAHDLRAPLGTILGHAKLLGRRAESADAVRGRAETIVASAQRMAAMLNDLVESALLEAGKLRLDLGPVNVAEMARDLRGRLAAPFDGERIRVEVAERVPHITADANRLERVLINLFTNALKYSAPGTEVTVRIDATADELVIAVEDHGQGIAPEDLPHLFERYFRAQQAFRFEGMGLGLYTARMLVEAHGGAIDVSTVAGEGSVFRVRLPISPPQR